MRFTIFSVLLFALAMPASAQLRPDEDTSRFVATVTEAWFDQLPKGDFATERAFFSTGLATQLSPKDWRQLREAARARTGGTTPRYRAHRLSYYPRNTLFAAVDFSAPAIPDGTYVCGTVIWSIAEANTIGLVRMEENIVETKIFRQMPRDQARKTLAEWYCPESLIVTILGL